MTDLKDVKHLADASSTSYASEYHRFGWLLFLALRIHAFSRFKDLVTCTNGLISILVSCMSYALFIFTEETCITTPDYISRM